MKFLFLFLFLTIVGVACAQAPFTAANFRATAPPVQSTTANIARLFTLNAQGVGETITPTKNWDAIVNTGTVDTTDILGFSALGRNLVDDTTVGAMQTTLGISAYAQTLLDDTTAGAVLTTLGVSAYAQTLLDDTTAGATLTTLGGTTMGQSYFALTNPSAITFPRQNANNTVTSRTATELKTDLAVENVTNTSDANKPVSTAQQTALNLKADLASPALTGRATVVNTRVSGLVSFAAPAPTVASGATIAPTVRVVFVSGVTQIDNITVPSEFSVGGGIITLIPTGVFTTGTGGNIALGSLSVINKALTMTYDSFTNKWYPSYQ